ncbi:unnamed protein product [Didymodactylos carnosus]|uniref:Uncharacterized protein n=1 Tax=Didymodactylos carnosus TaxID=1234261 RepID=A0A814JVH4_9BILA|nr:unnamed protein product [Didymodactylos carnosus]CAF1040896.1 unnamed protein product [Didymodactylos carnosus]CAF3606695.1 unnamed protein product [Didymodactylos carnosus]CAF3811118.1 unnamed protein product [Didymodactylos carnosus]
MDNSCFGTRDQFQRQWKLKMQELQQEDEEAEEDATSHVNQLSTNRSLEVNGRSSANITAVRSQPAKTHVYRRSQEETTDRDSRSPSPLSDSDDGLNTNIGNTNPAPVEATKNKSLKCLPDRKSFGDRGRTIWYIKCPDIMYVL